MGKKIKTDKIVIEAPAGKAGAFSTLFGYGFMLDVPCDISIKKLLEKNLEMDDDYIKNNIGTILHDGKPVDDPAGTTIKRNSTLALSAALPGLFGAAFRKQGKYAAMRLQGNKDDDKNGSYQVRGTITITVKLFNITAREIGPKLLQKGILISTAGFVFFWKNYRKIDLGGPLTVSVNGRRVDSESLTDSIQTENVILAVTTP